MARLNRMNCWKPACSTLFAERTLRVYTNSMPTQRNLYMFREPVPDQFAPAGKPFYLSLLLHGCFAFLVFHIGPVLVQRSQLQPRPPAPRLIYYQVPVLPPLKTLPHIVMTKAAAPEGRELASRSSLASADSSFAKNLAVLSKPRRPDNRRQTILQPHTPNIRIKVDLRLPDVIMQRSVADSIPWPTDNSAVPLERKQERVREQAPEISLKVHRLNSKLFPADSAQAALPVPLASATAPIVRKHEWRPSAVPELASVANPLVHERYASPRTEVPIPSLPAAHPIDIRRIHQQPSTAPTFSSLQGPVDAAKASISVPSLPVPISAANGLLVSRISARKAAPVPAISGAPTQKVSLPVGSVSQQPLQMPSGPIPKVSAAHSTPANPSRVPIPENEASLIILGVDPSPAVSKIVLPPGTRQGDFILTPPRKSVAKSSRTAPPTSREEATSHGRGQSRSAGSGTEKAANGGLIVRSSEAKTDEASGALGPPLPPPVIFPVPFDSPIRRNTMIVSAGPVGGGGLNVYGILNCGKIYSIFLSMPGKNWTMQYCLKPGTSQSPSDDHAVSIHWSERIVPPEPESKFDFRRSPVPADEFHRRIILKGILTAKGTVEELRVFQGSTPEMNQAARLAFSRWKFKPALHNGVPAAVELLVGIPLEPQ